jgi:hypothetical protein
MKLNGAVSALRLDFGPDTQPGHMGPRNGLRLAPAPGRHHGPDKYKELDLRRRRAQIKARRALEPA